MTKWQTSKTRGQTRGLPDAYRKIEVSVLNLKFSPPLHLLNVQDAFDRDIEDVWKYRLDSCLTNLTYSIQLSNSECSFCPSLRASLSLAQNTSERRRDWWVFPAEDPVSTSNFPNCIERNHRSLLTSILARRILNAPDWCVQAHLCLMLLEL